MMTKEEWCRHILEALSELGDVDYSDERGRSPRR